MSWARVAFLPAAALFVAMGSDALAIPCYPPAFIPAPTTSAVRGEVSAMRLIGRRSQVLWGTDRVIRVLTYRATVRVTEHLKGPPTPTEFAYDFTDKRLGCNNFPVEKGQLYVFTFTRLNGSPDHIEPRSPAEYERMRSEQEEYLRQRAADPSPSSPRPEASVAPSPN